MMYCFVLHISVMLFLSLVSCEMDWRIFVLSRPAVSALLNSFQSPFHNFLIMCIKTTDIGKYHVICGRQQVSMQRQL